MKPIRSGYVQGQPTGGPECEAFERELEAYYGVPYARVFNSGTSALHAAIIASDIVCRDGVLVPCYSMSASVACVFHAGKRPVFADIGDSYCLDWIATADRLFGSAPFGQAIVAHLFGHEASRGGGVWPLVHDCAQHPTQRPDNGHQQDVWVYSLNQHKVIQCGEGGYALTFSKEIADRLHLVRNHGESVSPDILGYNFRMTEMQAAVAREEFRHLDARIAARREWAREMQRKWDLPPDPGNVDWYLYPVRVKKDREGFAARIPGAQVGYHRLICDLPYFKAHGYGGEFPNARRIESELVVISPEAYGL